MPVAIHCGDPKAFWQPATPDNERWDELQAHPEWSFYGERRPLLAGALRRVRAPRGAPPEDHLHRRPLRRRPRGSRQRRAHARQVPQLLPRHGGARPGDRPPAAGEDAALLHEVPGPHPVRDRHRHRRRPGRHDVRLERRRAARPARTRFASSPRPGATSRRSTARSTARPPSRAAGRSTASACRRRSCARSTSTTPSASCAGVPPGA